MKKPQNRSLFTRKKKRIKKSKIIYGRACDLSKAIENRGVYAHLLGLMVKVGFPEPESRRAIWTLGEVFATANQRALVRMFSQFERLGRHFPKSLRASWENISRTLPRVPSGRPRHEDVDDFIDLKRQGKTRREIGIAIYGRGFIDYPREEKDELLNSLYAAARSRKRYVLKKKRKLEKPST